MDGDKKKSFTITVTVCGDYLAISREDYNRMFPHDSRDKEYCSHVELFGPGGDTMNQDEKG